MNNEFDDKKHETDEVYVDLMKGENNMHDGTISSSKYNTVIGLTLLWGFIINFFIVNFLPIEFYNVVSPGFVLIAYVILCLVGSLMSKLSSNPIVSFIGYNLVVIPMGFLLNMYIMPYSPYIVIRCITITGLVTLTMMLLSYAMPQLFSHLGKALGITLLITVLAEIICAFVYPAADTFFDYVVMILFCGYIGYDWYVANVLPKTFDNAIDCAANIYIDIINLFIRILARSSRRN